jgi:ligand-binding SRPBCC domain-containing protein
VKAASIATSATPESIARQPAALGGGRTAVTMRITEAFVVDAPLEVIVDYITDPSKLADWQTSKTSVEQLTEGPPGLGTRVRERTKPPGAKEFEQIVEFTEFDRHRRFHVHIVEGPYPIDGTWTFEPDGDRTAVSFAAEGDLRGPMHFLEPIFKWMMARQFAAYHRNLRRNVHTD